jgi:hypothetical protein
VGDKGIYTASYDLAPKDGGELPVCEADFLMVLPRPFPEKAELLLGECKDEGGRIDGHDVSNLRRIADALPPHRFDTFVVLAKLAPFTPEEIELARQLNTPYRLRAILLTARELEPYHLYERTGKEVGRTLHAYSAEALARATHDIYFREPQGEAS